jgi:hypothetical protein
LLVHCPHVQLKECLQATHPYHHTFDPEMSEIPYRKESSCTSVDPICSQIMPLFLNTK